MKNNKKVVKRFLKHSKKLIKKIEQNRFDEEMTAKIKGDLKNLDQGDYDFFCKLCQDRETGEHLNNTKLFLIEKVEAYTVHDFLSNEEYIRRDKYRCERNIYIIKIINKIISILSRIKNHL